MQKHSRVSMVYKTFGIPFYLIHCLNSSQCSCKWHRNSVLWHPAVIGRTSLHIIRLSCGVWIGVLRFSTASCGGLRWSAVSCCVLRCPVVVCGFQADRSPDSSSFTLDYCAIVRFFCSVSASIT